MSTDDIFLMSNSAEDIFQTMDRDKDGYLSREELGLGLEANDVPPTQKLLDKIFTYCDLNGDMKISLPEFSKFINEQNLKLKEFFGVFDKDNSGSVSVGEMEDIILKLDPEYNRDNIQEMIFRLDSNKDGQVTYQEFMKFYHMIPINNIKLTFNIFDKKSIDIGDYVTIPNEQPKSKELRRQTSPWVTLVAGGIAGAISRTTTAPCDRLKVIMQAREPGQNTSIAAEFKAIHMESGVKGFFKGNGTNVLKIIPETALKFLIYDEIKKLICTDLNSPSTGERLLSGAASGFLTQSIIYPMEITKTRLALAQDGIYKGIADCLLKIQRTEGTMALYKGWGASVLGIMPYAAIDLTIFNILRDMYIERVGRDPSTYTVLGCGALSSICGQVVSYPFALIRTRLQSQGLPGKPVLYHGLLDCTRKTYMNEGLRGFYRGILPNFMKSVPAVAISYAVFEKMKNVLKR